MTASPTFVATFADGVVTRLTTFCDNDNKLDMTRGVLLARHAYRQRTGREPVALIKAHFERDGTTLQAYSAIELDDTQAQPAAAPDLPPLEPAYRRVKPLKRQREAVALLPEKGGEGEKPR
jgi:hypothetical protein